jgi:glycosyltransferase involved in cell wall biosynthesis
MMRPDISVIISTYNKPDWLEKVFWGFASQTHPDFELVIADDGSGPATRELIDRARGTMGHDVLHVWHEDRGFQKSEILNKAIVAAHGNYLLFTDGDCIPRADFVAIHAQQAREGHFLSGGYVKLPMDISRVISEADVRAGAVTDAEWLRKQGFHEWRSLSKLNARGLTRWLLNAITPTKATWNGHNASGWKSDVLRVNGFDERMQYGGQDRELGERMVNAGVKPIQIRYSAVCVHLDHGRGYKTDESIARNQSIRRHTRDSGVAWTEFGIVKGADPSRVGKK